LSGLWYKCNYYVSSPRYNATEPVTAAAALERSLRNANVRQIRI